MEKVVKSMRLSKDTLEKLPEICTFHKRSEANEIEFLIEQEFERVQRLKRVISTETREELCNG